MASYAISRALSYLEAKSVKVTLKAEQEQAVENLLNGKDVMAVLPGFGKTMIFTVFCLAKKEATSVPLSVLVVSPLKSLITDQIAEISAIECSAVELCAATIESIIKDPPQFIYCTAEQVLEKTFLNALKDSRSLLHRRLSAIVIDESHTVETWAGKRFVT